MDDVQQSPVTSSKCPHKKTDFRREIWIKERRALRQKAKRNSFRVKLKQARLPGGKLCVTVDTSKARSNLDVLRMCLQKLKWREYPFGKKEGAPCDIHWHGVNFGENPDIPSGKVNKFPGMIELVRKINLTRTLDTMRMLFPDEFDFYPKSWFLPQQFPEFLNDVTRLNKNRHKGEARPVFIVKPDEGSQGDGIYLIKDPNDYMMTERNHIVQEYIDQPLLIEKLKFDFRVYVVVTNIDPVEIYISKEGLARFCTIPYQPPTNRNMHECYMHLTNYSLNKRSSTYVHTETNEDGSKRTLSTVLEQLASMGYDASTLWVNIEKLVLKTILAIIPELRIAYRAEVPPGKVGPTCFQILGFDILLKEDLSPILLEVNANPSLRIDYEHEIATGICEYLHSPVDEAIKKPVILDSLLLAAPPHKLIKPRSKYLEARRASQKSNSDEDDYDSDEEDDSALRLQCLVQIFPGIYGSEYQWLRIMERTSHIFTACLGVRGTLRMGSTSFRTFTRKCRLNTCGYSNAAIDILFIDLSKKWEHMNPIGTTGLCYQGYLEAFFILAKKKFPSGCKLGSVEKLIDYCEEQLENDRRSGSSSLPRLTKEDRYVERLQQAYGTMTIRKKPSFRGNDYFLDYHNFPARKKDKVVQTRQGKPSGKNKTIKMETRQSPNSYQ